MSKIGSEGNPLRVAIVGAGPSGFYAAGELLRQAELKVQVDLFEHLPTPYGLVRGGVAPDHQKIKSVTKVYEKTAAHPAFRFFGNVTYGKHLQLEDLLTHYHQVLFTTGAQTDRKLGVPGEDLAGSYPATDFVGWYNGHPDYRHLTFDLGQERVAVVGNGNVAMDVVRMLLAPVEELAQTDMADYALEALKHSKVKEVYLLGRRGPAQAAFTNPEIRELCDLHGVSVIVRPQDMELDAISQTQLAKGGDPTSQRNVDILKAQAQHGDTGQPRKVHIRFFVSPVEVLGQGRVSKLRLELNRPADDGKGGLKAVGTGQFEELPVDVVFRSIGYKGQPLPGLPFDDRAGIIPNSKGRVSQNVPAGRVYTAGWIKRGPTGVIGTNKACAVETVTAMLEDLAALQLPAGFSPKPDALLARIQAQGQRLVSYADWQKLDQAEITQGQAQGQPRRKFTAVEDMLRIL